MSLGLSISCLMFQFTQNPPEAAHTREASQPAKAHATPLPRRYYLAAAALILLTALPTLLVYPQLPSVVPLQGETNAFGPKWSLFLYTPALMIGILLIVLATQLFGDWLPNGNFDIANFGWVGNPFAVGQTVTTGSNCSSRRSRASAGSRGHWSRCRATRCRRRPGSRAPGRPRPCPRWRARSGP